MGLLHDALANGFNQVTGRTGQGPAILGDIVTIKGIECTVIFSPADEKSTMEVVGYMVDCDLLGVVGTDQIELTEADENLQLLFNAKTFVLKGIKSDPSSYTLILKQISA